MDIPSVATRVGYRVPLKRALQPVAEIRSDLPARQEGTAHDTPRSTGERVELARFQTRTGVEQGLLRPVDDLSSLRGVRAIHAYTALERTEQREYVSSVLGINEFA